MALWEKILVCDVGLWLQEKKSMDLTHQQCYASFVFNFKGILTTKRFAFCRNFLKEEGRFCLVTFSSLSPEKGVRKADCNKLSAV